MKLKKIKSSLYELEILGNKYQIFDDVILKYNLLTVKDIDTKLLNELLSDNDKYIVYHEALKYLSKKLRTESELIKYLSLKYDKSIVLEQVKLLKKNGYLDELTYIKAFINDQVNLSSNGPLKIKDKLINLGLDEKLVDNYLSSFDCWEDRVEKIVNKLYKSNTKYSSFKLRGKAFSNLINFGYEKELINSVLDKYKNSDREVLIKEYNKYYNKFSSKYSGYELKQVLFKKLSSLGFDYEDVNNIIEQ